MRFSSRIEACELSPIRKFYPYMVAAEAKGRKVLHLNIGQPDIETPQEFFDAVNSYGKKVLDYAPSPGVGEFLDAIQNYFKNVGIFPSGNNTAVLNIVGATGHNMSADNKGVFW